MTKGQLENLPQVLKLLVGQTSAAHAAAGLSSTSAKAVGEDARRKEESGDSWLGQQINTIQQLYKQGARTTAKPTPPPVGGYGPDTSSRDLWKRIFK